jgi:hypothetical protein
MNKDKLLDLAWLAHSDCCSLMAAALRLDGCGSAIGWLQLGDWMGRLVLESAQ